MGFYDLIPMILIALYLFKCSPELLKRRLDIKEKKPKQGIIAKMFYISVGLFLYFPASTSTMVGRQCRSLL
ncbi:MAG: hypothetical protein KJ995_01270 [Candidatus Omnitrophica bacterium]|nr:hypothetical protein [Candidatus Omnitrophota bacterium]MBU1656966.1 hypothetical protein [Candidatus Omnitrophota bacterium]MBU1784026.1 hypothetical protein [Candidatus Omnitrophota bacterium]MBU1851020.1 hypothetical protein [Candidatus Omnitrophota bacterium]